MTWHPISYPINDHPFLWLLICLSVAAVWILWKGLNYLGPLDPQLRDGERGRVDRPPHVQCWLDMIPLNDAYDTSAYDIDSNTVERDTSSYQNASLFSSVSSKLSDIDAAHVPPDWPLLLPAMDHGLVGRRIGDLNDGMMHDLESFLDGIDAVMEA
ncbi:MAG: hypothetical protein Q9190_001170 [Brigantiaea leucoxantha]